MLTDRLSSPEGLSRLEPDEGKLSRPVRRVKSVRKHALYPTSTNCIKMVGFRYFGRLLGRAGFRTALRRHHHHQRTNKREGDPDLSYYGCSRGHWSSACSMYRDNRELRF
jgi:hypothetical protein